MEHQSVETHKEKFYAKVMEIQGNKGKNSRMLTEEHYANTVQRLKLLENQATPTDSNLLRRFAQDQSRRPDCGKTGETWY